MQEEEGSVAHPGSGFHAQRPDDGVVRIGVDAIFHLDVLKLTAPKVDGSDAPFGGKTKRQMSLDLEDL
jgi:hypothetical protein